MLSFKEFLNESKKGCKYKKLKLADNEYKIIDCKQNSDGSIDVTYKDENGKKEVLLIDKEDVKILLESETDNGILEVFLVPEVGEIVAFEDRFKIKAYDDIDSDRFRWYTVEPNEEFEVVLVDDANKMIFLKTKNKKYIIIPYREFDKNGGYLV